MIYLTRIGCRYLFLFSVSLMVSSCAELSSVEHSGSNIGGGKFSDPDDFQGVHFNPGQPSAGKSLLDALSSAHDQEALLSDLLILKRMPPDVNLRVLGFTDSVECRENSCVELSLRRAQALHEWLLSRGVSKSRLSAPYGFGSARPVGDNQTEEGRARNRRAYISYEDIP